MVKSAIRFARKDQEAWTQPVIGNQAAEGYHDSPQIRPSQAKDFDAGEVGDEEESRVESVIDNQFVLGGFPGNGYGLRHQTYYSEQT